MNCNKTIKCTKIPQTVDEYNAELAKLSESIHNKRFDGISSGILAACAAGIGYNAGDLLGGVWGDYVRFAVYGTCGLFSVIFITQMANKLTMAGILKNSYREMEKRRNQLKKSMAKTNER